MILFCLIILLKGQQLEVGGAKKKIHMYVVTLRAG